MAYTQINPATGKKFRLIGAPVVKKDAKALVTGKPVYTDDLALKDCLIVKVLRSPHAHALIEEIDCKVASRVPGSNVSLHGKMFHRSVLPWPDRRILSQVLMTV